MVAADMQQADAPNTRLRRRRARHNRPDAKCTPKAKRPTSRNHSAPFPIYARIDHPG